MDSKKHLIGKYLKDEITLQEKEALEIWINQSEVNSEEFNSYKKIWDRTGGLRKDQTADVNEAWNRFVGMRSRKRSKMASMPGWISKAAAVLIIGISLSYLAWDQWRKPDMVHIVAQAHKHAEILLPDGTKAWLNRNSKLSYPSEFEASNREVQLEGEAFFEVMRNEGQPFVITASDVGVKVLGTSFNIKTEVDFAEVVVVTGKVSFYNLESKKQQVVLNPSDKGIFSGGSGHPVKKRNTDPNFLAWKTGKLIFENTTLNDVAKSVSTFYDKKVELANPDLSTCRINTEFDSQPLEEVLEEISLLLEVAYEVYPDKVVITGRGCQVKE